MTFSSIACVGIPFIGAGLLRRTKSRNATALLTWLTTTIVFGLSVYFFVQTRASYPLSDMTAAIFSLISAFTWWLVSFYLPEYMKAEERSRSFFIFFLLTLGAVQGIFLANNWIVLLAFFEIMTVTSFFWVIHNQNQEAITAGYFYLFLGIAAGLFIAIGLVFINSLGLPLEIGVNLVSLSNSTLLSWAIACLLIGFGIKAGMVPLHIWLPKAHTVAPTPGSALLSGIIIKCGVYGMIRTAQTINLTNPMASFPTNTGLIVIILGILTMLLGVSLALLQSNAKRLLAYHSVSQVGYIIIGIGTAIYLGNEGSYGLAGAIYHTINHAFFKAALFLGTGIIYLRTGQQNLYKMGGLWRKFPITALLMLIAVFGITGTPGFNGYVSKSLLHHGIIEAAAVGGGLLPWIERLFNLVGVGTTASFAKLYYLAFLRKADPELEINGKENGLLIFPLLIFALVITFIGIKPELFLNKAIILALPELGVSSINNLLATNFWVGREIFNMIITLLAGISFCAIGFRFHLFHYQPPAWLSIEYLGRNFIKGLSYLGSLIERKYEQAMANLSAQAKTCYTWILNFSSRLDTSGWGASGQISFSNINFDVYLILIAFAILLIYILL